MQRVCVGGGGLQELGWIRDDHEYEVIASSPLGVVENGKKLKLIDDLRCVNMQLAKAKFKLKEMKVVASVYGLEDSRF